MNNSCDNSEFESENDVAWKKIFDELNILKTIQEQDIFYLSARDIKKIGKREPRLMARMESSVDRATIFEINDLTILQQGNRGEYVIGKFDAFTSLDYSNHVKNKKITPYQNSEINNPLCPTREPEAILNAYNYGMFSEIANYPQDDLKMVSFGRRGTQPFEYSINIKNKNKSCNLKIETTQMELDGVFECLDGVILVEAKINQRPDFITRQLFYPYRALSTLTEKPITSIFLTATTTGSIYAHVFEFKNDQDYNSVVQVDAMRYDFFEPISLSDIREVINESQIEPEPLYIMFPQADSVDRLFQVLDIVNAKPGIIASEIGERMEISGRQGAYYSAACIYLGLLKRDKHGQSYKYRLTDYAIEMVNSSWKKRNLMMVKAISKHLVFHHFIKEYLDTQQPPSKAEIATWLRNNINKLNNENGTPDRRAGTVMGWITWIVQITAYDDC